MSDHVTITLTRAQADALHRLIAATRPGDVEALAEREPRIDVPATKEAMDALVLKLHASLMPVFKHRFASR